MKKVILIVALIVLVTVLSGCSATVTEKRIEKESMFVVVESASMYSVLYDRKTKVMYAVSKYGSGSGVFTLLVNADGTPKLWKGDQQ